MEQVAAIILAAGKGTRFKAQKVKNKVTHEIGRKPMVVYTVDHLRQAGIEIIIAVVGFAAGSVKQVLGGQVTYAHQSKRLGTGHAVKIGLQSVPKPVKTLISMYGDDSAFYPPSLFRALIDSHRLHEADISLVTVHVPNPAGLGRIIRDQNGQMRAIVEERNANRSQKLVHEINTGLFCFKRSFLENSLPLLKKNPVSGEYYLTDLITLAVTAGLKVNTLIWPDNSIWHGVNTREELITANNLMGLSAIES
jgi:bifunctional UDP-N-acetylglucosamine pyrophosphorylase/glucosamine-1-phosphate N-acetyltransferase